MIDVFSPLPPEARRETIAAYSKFLADRDGVLDVERRTLSHREEKMARHSKPLARVRDMDRALFDAQYTSFDAKKATPPEMLLLLTLLKANAAEAFGVNTTIEKVFREAVAKQDNLELTLLVEEHYHTRILLSSAVLYGIEVTSPYTPAAAFRALIHGIAISPKFMARPLTLAAEILGTLVFLNMLYKCREVLADDPELRDAVEERICEVLIDELGHVTYNRMCLGAAGLAQAKFLLPIVASAISRAVPETVALDMARLAVAGPRATVGVHLVSCARLHRRSRHAQHVFG